MAGDDCGSNASSCKEIAGGGSLGSLFPPKFAKNEESSCSLFSAFSGDATFVEGLVTEADESAGFSGCLLGPSTSFVSCRVFDAGFAVDGGGVTGIA